MINKKSVFNLPGIDKGLDMPEQDGDQDLQDQIDDLKERVSALEHDRASGEDLGPTANDENISAGPNGAKPGLGKLGLR
jgi:hypothetical protein